LMLVLIGGRLCSRWRALDLGRGLGELLNPHWLHQIEIHQLLLTGSYRSVSECWLSTTMLSSFSSSISISFPVVRLDS
jgi:hypothetical protein